ncbi:MAG: hypothetical protein ACYDGM_05075 [Vulcanimicrobiaceae bacterium]
MTKSSVLLAACSLAARVAGGCAWCGTPLPARRRTWCSDRCGDAFWKNHWWSLARRAAKRRDKYRCTKCGHALPKRPARTAFRTEAAYKNAMSAWRAARKTGRLEVNHIVAAHGRHAQISCVHHVENLETLCIACHAIHTATLRDRAKAVKAERTSVAAG